MKLIEGVQPQEDVTHKLYEAGKFASGGKTVVCLGRKTEEDRSVKKRKPATDKMTCLLLCIHCNSQQNIAGIYLKHNPQRNSCKIS